MRVSETLIIKLGAMGDVLRTTTLLRALPFLFAVIAVWLVPEYCSCLPPIAG